MTHAGTRRLPAIDDRAGNDNRTVLYSSILLFPIHPVTTSAAAIRRLLQDNKLNGTLPDDWARLRSLRVLHLDNNLLTGTLPASWSAAGNLTELGLSGNRLRGNISAAWANGTELRCIFLIRKSLQCPTAVIPI